MGTSTSTLSKKRSVRGKGEKVILLILKLADEAEDNAVPIGKINREAEKQIGCAHNVCYVYINKELDRNGDSRLVRLHWGVYGRKR